MCLCVFVRVWVQYDTGRLRPGGRASARQPNDPASSKEEEDDKEDERKVVTMLHDKLLSTIWGKKEEGSWKQNDELITQPDYKEEEGTTSIEVMNFKIMKLDHKIIDECSKKMKRQDLDIFFASLIWWPNFSICSICLISSPSSSSSDKSSLELRIVVFN